MKDEQILELEIHENNFNYAQDLYKVLMLWLMKQIKNSLSTKKTI